MHPRTFWEVKGYIIGPLAEIYASSAATGGMPEEWKGANAVPLFRKDGVEKPKDCRSLNIKSVVVKLLEQILRGRIYLHLGRQGQIGMVSTALCVGNHVLQT